MAWVDVTPEEAAAELKRINETKPPPLVPSNVAPNLAEMEAKQLEQGPVRIDPNFRPGIKIANPSEDAEFTKARQESAMGTPGFRKAAGAVIPTLAMGSAFVPGLQGVAAQTLIGGGAAALNQMLGLEDTKGSTEVEVGGGRKINAGSVAVGAAMPAATRAIVGGVKSAFKGASEFIAPASLREAGVEATAERVGAPATSAARVAAGTVDTDLAYQAARGVAGFVPTHGPHTAITTALQQELRMANPNPTVVRTLQGLQGRFGRNVILQHGAIIDESQRLARTARDLRDTDSVAANGLREVRDALLDASDAVSPALREANALYRTRLATEDLIDAARTTNPGVEVRRLLEGRGGRRTAQSLGLNTQREINEVYALSDAMNDVAASAPGGLAVRGLAAIMAGPSKLLATPAGRYLLRQLIKPTGRLTRTGAAAAGQFARAWEAQEADRGGE